jgi:hypothetical protein
LAIYLIVSSSKGISSVYLGKLIGISQKSAWKLGHAIRSMMDPGSELWSALTGIVELDEKYIGGKPRIEHGSIRALVRMMGGIHSTTVFDSSWLRFTVSTAFRLKG